MSCGKMLTTPEKQTAAIDHVEASHKKSRIATVIRIIVFLIIIGVVYYFLRGNCLPFSKTFFVHEKGTI